MKKPPSDYQRKGLKRLILLFLGLLLWLNHFCPGADPVIRVGIYESEPAIYLDEKEKPAGIFVDLLNEIAREEGWKLEYVPCYWKQCIKALQTQQIDLLPGVVFSLQRNETLEFNKIPVITSWSPLYTRPGTPLERFADLQGKRVVLLEGSIHEEKFERLMRGFGYHFFKIPARTYRDAFVFVQKGMATAAVVDVLFGTANFARYGLKPTPVLINPTSLYFASRKGGNRQILAAIDQYLDNWIKTPNSLYYRKLADYMEKQTRQVPAGLFRWPMILALVLLFSALVLILVMIKKAAAKSRKLKTISRRLREEENKFRSYIENSPYAIFVADENGDYTDVNPTAEFITGYSRAELLEKNLLEMIPAESRQAASSHFSQLLSRGKAVIITPFVKKDGEQRHWSVNAVKISGDRYLAFVRDVTDQFHAEEELKQKIDQLPTEVARKTHELQKRVSELEHFHHVTVERELRIDELRNEIRKLKNKKP